MQSVMLCGTAEHIKYMKEFRVEQCPYYLEHNCPEHKPFTCFHWHVNSQRRRMPVQKEDGSFNYCADDYCTKYDKATGKCVNGDECPLLHRVVGDTEHHYHPLCYKTLMCVHNVDSSGLCKNGKHCMHAHGPPELRELHKTGLKEDLSVKHGVVETAWYLRL